MRKLALAVAYLAAAPVIAQTPPRPMFPGVNQAGSTVTASDGTTVFMPWVVPATSNGAPAPAGTAADPVNVTGGGTPTDVQGNGTLALATVGSSVVIPLAGGRSSLGLRISGLTGSGAIVTVQRSNDGGTTYTSANTTESSATATLSSTLTADGQPRVGAAGATNIRLIVTTAGTGTASVAYNASTGPGPVFLVGNLPSTTTPGVGVIGNVGVLNGGNVTEGSTTDAAYTDATGAAAGSLVALNKGQFVTLGTLFKAGQSIGNTGFNAFGSAGTALQQGNAAAASANSANVYIGGQNAALNVTSTPAAGSTTTVVQPTAANLNVTVVGTGTFGTQVTNFPATQTVNGTVTANATGSVTTAAPTYTTGSQNALSLTTAGALRTDASATTQPVSGTVTANQGGAPWSQNLTQVGGTTITLGQKTQANSVPVTLASDGSYATSANQNSTAAGTSATNAQAVQGVTGGVAMPISSAQEATIANNQTNGGQKTQVVDSAAQGWLFYNGAPDALTNSVVTPPVQSRAYVFNGSSWDRQRSDPNVVGSVIVIPQPVATAGAGILPATVNNTAANPVKTAAGNLYAINVVNSTAAGFVVVLNATAAPAAGTAVTPLYCMPIAASVGLRDTFNPPLVATTGITIAVSTACATYNAVGTAPTQISGQAK